MRAHTASLSGGDSSEPIYTVSLSCGGFDKSYCIFVMSFYIAAKPIDKTAESIYMTAESIYMTAESIDNASLSGGDSSEPIYTVSLSCGSVDKSYCIFDMSFYTVAKANDKTAKSIDHAPCHVAAS